MTKRRLLCPSAPADAPDAVVIGVVRGTPAEPRVRFTERAVPPTRDLLNLVDAVTPEEVFRTAAPCACSGCGHFARGRCTLAAKITRHLAAVTTELPECSIRDNCRWFSQEGAAACRRCPQVVTRDYGASPTMAVVANPDISQPEAVDALQAPLVGTDGRTDWA